MSDSASYPLGYSEDEARRLTRQAALLEEPTAQLLSRAGLCAGMRVLAAWDGFDYMVSVVRSLLPLMERFAIASAAEIDIDTLASRLREDAIANESVTYLPRLVGAWTQTPS